MKYFCSIIVFLYILQRIHSIKLNELCTDDAGCSTIPNSNCDQKKCVCNKEYKANAENTKCDKVIECLEKDHLKQQDEQCVCLDNYVRRDLTDPCLPKAKLNETCEKNYQCMISDSLCKNKICHCKEKYKATDDMKSCTIDCTKISNSEAKNDKCKCINGFVSYPNEIFVAECLSKASKENNACKINEQCANLNGTTCKENMCKSQGLTLNNNNALIITVLVALLKFGSSF